MSVMDRSAGRSSRGDAPEVLVGRVAVPKTGQKTPSSHWDVSEVPVDRVAVPKTGRNMVK